MATPKLLPVPASPRPTPRRRPAGRRTTWRGGIIRYDKEGTPHYYLWRKTGGERYRLSLGVTSEEGAGSTFWTAGGVGVAVTGAGFFLHPVERMTRAVIARTRNGRLERVARFMVTSCDGGVSRERPEYNTP